MKIFKFNPETAKKGEQIDNLPLMSWTHMGVDYAVKQGEIQPIEYNKPVDTATEEWIVHVDAGDKDSYLRDEWICFCQGELSTGEDNAVWTWIILPPKSLIKKIVKMRTYITAFPIHREFQESIGIYDSGYVHQEEVGKVMHALIEAGHTKINSFVETDGPSGEQRLTIHMSF